MLIKKMLIKKNTDQGFLIRKSTDQENTDQENADQENANQEKY